MFQGISKNFMEKLFRTVLVTSDYAITVKCCISYRNQLLICSANEVTGLYMKWNTGLKWVNGFLLQKRFFLQKSMIKT